ncbi:Cell division inhibitor SulA [Colwellia chukchiensis]|uniref:Cell division inhibitor SulA n=1 Tax=Colwellia chukchiensis TaxID=641665 RepID=A0A1H7MIZ5_9GAMM|nr:translesion DNA synthesis-associated protein ImuA [Colwellia chukchiensis]SEL11081.1 Cell division inhibitor SulA [Colwellia chukchiensis]
MNKMLNSLQRQGKIWSAKQSKAIVEAVASGYPEIDQHLQGGFPRQGVIEVQSLSGIGEIRLFLPYLQHLFAAELKQHQQARQLVFIAPPAQINALSLLQAAIPLENILLISSEKPPESLWAAEQCLKSGCCLAVLLWQQQLAVHQIKRLKQAANTGDAIQVIFRAPNTFDLALPVSLSLALEAIPAGLKIQVKKQMAAWPSRDFIVDMHQRWPSLTEKQPASASGDQALSHLVVPLSSRQRLGAVLPS